ncbi:MAG: PLP-dependent aminotransferase family protein, partial [Chloroflexi bacterium]|nr:PLP-dependent aminotransferase family protein [Chloroflexota bacterium]
VESPTYLGALEVFRATGARLIGVPVDEQGMRIEAAEQIMGHVNARLIYTNPNFQNPTGSTLSAERRAALLSLAQRFQVPILEDDLHSELSYDTSAPAPIRAADEGGCVLYLGSLSPVLGPGLRLGWLVAPSAVIESLTTLRQAMDLHPSNFIQEVVYELLISGSFDAHLEWVRRAYAARRDVMLAALRQYMPESVRWNRPQGGFYVWCSLEKSLHSRELLEEAAAEGVVFVPGEAFFPDGRGEQFIRLSFAHAPTEEIAEGIRRLAKAVRKLEKREWRGSPIEADRPIV